MSSPYQLLYNTPPDYSLLRVFGCSCYPWQKPLASHKLSPRAPACIFLGYSDTSKGYRCYNPQTRKLITSRHVVFDEHTFPFTHSTSTSSTSSIPLHPQLLLPTSHSTISAAPLTISPLSPTPPASVHSSIPATIAAHPTITTHGPSLNSTPQPIPCISLIPSPTPTPNTAPDLSHFPISPSNQSLPANAPTHHMTTRLKAGITKPKHLLNLHSAISIETEPTCYSQAIKSPHWRRAMSDEFLALQQQATWKLVPPPSDQNIIGCRWTFRLKRHADGSIARYKARLVAQGFTQEPGVDYHETFSPVARIATVRLFLTVAAIHQWDVHQFDVANAFLHGNLDGILYMKQPPGFQDTQLPNHVCLLQKALYGLKQAPRLWYSTFSTHLRQQGFQVSTADPSLLLYRKHSTCIYLLLYVDDFLIAGNNPTFITNLITHLHTKFNMKALGPISSFLGIHVTKTPTGFFLSQATYLQSILHTAGFQQSKPVTTPVSLKNAPTTEPSPPFSQPTHYRRLAGSLQYLTITRPDIAHSVNMLCQHMQEPTVQHFQLLKRVLRYLQATPTLGLPITAGSPMLTAYSDADWAGDALTRRSTTGFCVYLGSTLISWKVHK